VDHVEALSRNAETLEHSSDGVGYADHLATAVFPMGAGPVSWRIVDASMYDKSLLRCLSGD